MASGDRIYIGERESFTVADLITNNKLKIVNITIPVGASVSDLINITGSGLLYLATMSYSGDEHNTNEIFSTVTVDNIVICNKQISQPGASNTTGVITPQGIVKHPFNLTTLGPRGNNNFSFNSVNYITEPKSQLDTTTDLIYVPKPIRFTSSLKITGRATVDASNFSCIYELD